MGQPVQGKRSVQPGPSHPIYVGATSAERKLSPTGPKPPCTNKLILNTTSTIETRYDTHWGQPLQSKNSVQLCPSHTTAAGPGTEEASPHNFCARMRRGSTATTAGTLAQLSRHSPPWPLHSQKCSGEMFSDGRAQEMSGEATRRIHIGCHVFLAQSWH